MKIKAILFDKDGTLFHYAATWGVWTRGVLLELTNGNEEQARRIGLRSGYNWSSDSFVAGSPIVNGAADEVNRIWSEELPEFSIEQIDAVCIRHLETAPAAPVCDFHTVFPGFRGLGYKLGVATNDFEIGATSQLGEHDATQYFDFVCGCDSGFGAKPGPGMIYGFCEHLGLSPKEVAMVGDSTHDLFAGQAAGVGLCVGVLTGPADASDIAHAADIILPDITGLADHLSTL
ncbi:MAG: HAD family hydrolase [Pseudomonadota bacterium]